MMNDLEKMVRNALADGSMSTGDMADTLANILNKIEQEKKTAAQQADMEKKMVLENLKLEFGRKYSDHPRDMTARDAAIVALMAVAENPENTNWTADDIAGFVKNLTETIETTSRLWEGHTDSDEDRLDHAMKVAGEKFNTLIEGLFEKGAFDKITKRLEQFVDCDFKPGAAPKQKPSLRPEVDRLRKWLEEQGW